MHIKMQVRTFKLAKYFRGCIHVPRFNRGGGREWGKGRVREKERRGKGKGSRHYGREGRKGGMGNSDGGGIAPLLLGGIDATGLRKNIAIAHCSWIE